MTAPGRAGVRLENPRYRLSRVTATVFAVLLVAGIAEGAAEYARRSPKIEQHVAGTNAITIHVLIAVAAAAAVISIQARRSRRPPGQRGPSPWAAPFSACSASRLRRTVLLAGGLSLPNLARAVAAVPLVLVLLYTPFRMGMQITGGLDPNATVNAWGGPTYLGALLAHWLDAIVGCYAAAFLLSSVLLPAAAKNPWRTPRASRPSSGLNGPGSSPAPMRWPRGRSQAAGSSLPEPGRPSSGG